MFRVIEIVRQPMAGTILLEMAGKLAAIISLDSFDGKRGYPKEFIDKVMAVGRRVGLICISEGKSGSDIDRSEDITFQPGSENGNRIHLYQVTGLCRGEALTAEFLLMMALFYVEGAGITIQGDFVRPG